MIRNNQYPNLIYDPVLGVFYNATTGKRQGYLDKTTNYWRISSRGKIYSLHRLAWFFMNNSFPINDIDHIDGNKSNNSYSNLRDVSKSENKQNVKTYTRTNKSTKLLGTSIHKLKDDIKYRAQISINGKNRHLGLFETPEEAYRAYLKAKRKYHKGNML